MYIKINGCQLFFDTYGSKLDIQKKSVEEKPTLLVLHGGPGIVDHTLYVDFWSQFSNIAQVIFLDQRGCGRSEKRTPAEWHLQQWADDAKKFCEVLNIAKPIIAGVSMGGHVMCDFITQYPSEAGGLIFCNTEAQFIVEEVCQAFGRLGGELAESSARQYFTAPSPESAKNYQEHCGKHLITRGFYTPEALTRCKQNMAV
ncbi:MAG: alpha/beta hydrolase [Pseudomonadota bacterium]